ncbi:hypothetical protein SGCOL_006987, partial [Colletotrichum sp. CLE4]
KVLEEYKEMIMDTIYRLNVRLQRIDEKMDGLTTEVAGSVDASGMATDLEDERVVTERCLRICEDAQHYLETLASDGDLLKQQLPPTNSGNVQSRLDSLPLDRSHAHDDERTRLLQHLDISKQRLDMYEVAPNMAAWKDEDM